MIKAKKKIVSIVIPTRNAGKYLENCLKSIQKQSYPAIEVVIVDGKSTDNTASLAKKYKATFYTYLPKLPPGTFDASYKRNYGVKKAKGYYVYYVDADMELGKNVVKEAVELCEKGYDAVILPEDSFGIGIWASAKNLQRRCYWGDSLIEAPRFFKKSVWMALGGLDVAMGGGGDDWDLGQAATEKGYKTGRIKSMVRNNEGDLKLGDLFRKRIIYGKDIPKYVSKRKDRTKVFFPLRGAYLRNWRLFVKRPKDACAFLIMRSVELTGALIGVSIYMLKNK